MIEGKTPDINYQSVVLELYNPSWRHILRIRFLRNLNILVQKVDIFTGFLAFQTESKRSKFIVILFEPACMKIKRLTPTLKAKILFYFYLTFKNYISQNKLDKKIMPLSIFRFGKIWNNVLLLKNKTKKLLINN